MPCDVVLEVHNGCSEESFNLPVGLGWYMAVVNCCISDRTFTATISLETNCFLLWVSTYVIIPYRMTQRSTNTVAALVDVSGVTDMGFVSSVYRSGKTISCWLQDFVFVNETRISITRHLRGLAAGNKRRYFSWRGFVPFSGRNWQLAICVRIVPRIRPLILLLKCSINYSLVLWRPKQDSAPCKVCALANMYVRPSVLRQLFHFFWPFLYFNYRST